MLGTDNLSIETFTVAKNLVRKDTKVNKKVLKVYLRIRNQVSGENNAAFGRVQNVAVVP